MVKALANDTTTTELAATANSTTTTAAAASYVVYDVALQILGYILTAMSAVCRYPQIIKIYHNKSGYGVSETATIMELTAYTVTTGYNLHKRYGIDSYAEMPLLSISSAIMLLQIEFYDRNWFKMVFFITEYLSWIFLFAVELLNTTTYTVLQSSIFLVHVASKSAQIYMNYCNKHTGYLSTAMTAMMWFIALGRILTTYHRTGDMLLTALFTVITTLNTVILYQIHYYRSNTVKFIEREQRKKIKEHEVGVAWPAFDEKNVKNDANRNEQKKTNADDEQMEDSNKNKDSPPDHNKSPPQPQEDKRSSPTEHKDADSEHKDTPKTTST